MFIQNGNEPEKADERALDFLATFGFNFVRIPSDYRVWTPDFDYFHPQERFFDYLDGYLDSKWRRIMPNAQKLKPHTTFW